jgi:hypothetical protein
VANILAENSLRAFLTFSVENKERTIIIIVKISEISKRLRCCSTFVIIIRQFSRNMSSCKICDHQLGSKSPGVQCGFCSCFYHAKCLSLPREQLSAFRDIPGVAYKCEDCREKKNTEYTSFVDAIKRLEALIKSLQDEIIQLKQEKNSDEAVMNQVGNSKIPPSGHLIFFSLPTYAMKIKPVKFKNGQERVIVPS